MNDGVRLHYHIRGVGPPVVLLHGFPEYWNVWRHQIEDLSRNYRVIAPDLRGFNLSDRPQGVEQYAASVVASDVLAILSDLGIDKAAVVGHDIGGMIAWWIASYARDRVDRLAIMSAPHPVLYLTARKSPTQRRASPYIDRMLESGRNEPLRPDRLPLWLANDEEREELEVALRLSDAEAVANYYRCNLSQTSLFLTAQMPHVKCRTLVLYGPEDPYILPLCYEGTRQWVDGPLEIKALPGRGHFLHHSAADTVTAELRSWLDAA